MREELMSQRFIINALIDNTTTTVERLENDLVQLTAETSSTIESTIADLNRQVHAAAARTSISFFSLT